MRFISFISDSTVKSSDVIHKFCPINPTIGYSAWPHQDSVIWLASKIALLVHRAIVSALGTPQLQAKPYPWGKICGANVADCAHLTGAGQKDLGALMELHRTLHTCCSGCAAPTASQHGVFGPGKE